MCVLSIGKMHNFIFTQHPSHSESHFHTQVLKLKFKTQVLMSNHTLQNILEQTEMAWNVQQLCRHKLGGN
jgi:hypothetical protein